MNINHVTLDNGTVISYGFDEETGDVDHSTITIGTETEIVAIRPKNTVYAVGVAIQVETILRIDFLDEADEDDDDADVPQEIYDLYSKPMTGCGNHNCVGCYPNLHPKAAS